MRKLISYIKSVNNTLNTILLISLLSILLIDLYFNEMPELFDGATELLNAYYNLCIGLAVSYIFYFVVVHIKEFKDKENINAYVSKKSKNIVNDYKNTIKAIKKKLNVTTDVIYFPEEKIEEFFSLIDPHSDAPMIDLVSLQHLNWVQFMEHYRIRSQKVISKIFIKMTFLDSEHVRLLSAVDDCAYFLVIETASIMEIRNKDLSCWASVFHGYSKLCQDLELYNSRFE